MSIQERLSLAFILGVGALTLLPPARCCSPVANEKPLNITEKVLHAKVVLYGRILNTYSDPRFDYGSGSTVYTAEVKVYCSLKGPTLQTDVINITEAGIYNLKMLL